MSGIEAAQEILTKYPSTPIIFLTAYAPFFNELLKYPLLKGNNIQVLLKPVKLPEMEDAMLKLVNQTD